MTLLLMNWESSRMFSMKITRMISKQRIQKKKLNPWNLLPTWSPCTFKKNGERQVATLRHLIICKTELIRAWTRCSCHITLLLRRIISSMTIHCRLIQIPNGFNSLKMLVCWMKFERMWSGRIQNCIFSWNRKIIWDNVGMPHSNGFSLFGQNWIEE